MENKKLKSIWNRKDLRPGAELSDDRKEFLYTVMIENLNHARHVENERITFNSIFIALAAGVLAFLSSLQEFVIQLGILIILFVMGLIAMLLTIRWNNVFSRHIDSAKRCYKLLHHSVFSEDPDEGYETLIDDPDGVISRELLPGLEELPAYNFSPRDPDASSPLGRWMMRNLRTKTLFNFFYILLEASIVIIAVLVIFKEFA